MDFDIDHRRYEVNWRAKGLLIGGVTGALLGMLVGWIVLEDSSRGGEAPTGRGEGRGKLRPADAAKLLTVAVTLVRQIADIRNRPS